MTARVAARLIALVPAAGGGSRFGGTTPKQYAPLAGRPLLAHTLDRLHDALDLHGIAIAIAPDDLRYDREIGVRDGVMVLRCGGSNSPHSHAGDSGPRNRATVVIPAAVSAVAPHWVIAIAAAPSSPLG